MKLLAFRALCLCVFCLPAATHAAGVQWDPDGSVHPANRLNPHFRSLMVTSNTALRQLTVTNTITAGGLVVAAPTFSSFANSPHNHQDAIGGAQLNASSVFSAGTVPPARLGSGTPDSTTFLRGDSTWQSPGGGGIGDVVGPSSATNNNMVRFDTGTGKLIQDSSVNVEDDGDMLTPGGLSVGVGSTVAGHLGMGEGTAPALSANTITFHAPVDVAAGGVNYIPSGTASTGFQLWTDSSGVLTGTIVASTGSGNVLRAVSPTMSDPIFTSTMFFEGLVFTIEGAVANGFETFFVFTEPIADATYTFGGTDLSVPGTITYPDNIRQTFNPGADAAGINVGSQAGDPGTPTNGDLWYDSVANELTARINGANVALGAGGGSAVYVNATEVTNPNFQTNSALKYTISASTNVIIDFNDDDKTLTDAATIATDCSVGVNFIVTLGGNRILGAPSNGKPGRFYSWTVVQDGTGNRTLDTTTTTNFLFGTDITGITLSTNATYRDYIRAKCRTDNTNVFDIVGFVRGYR